MSIINAEPAERLEHTGVEELRGVEGRGANGGGERAFGEDCLAGGRLAEDVKSLHEGERLGRTAREEDAGQE